MRIVAIIFLAIISLALAGISYSLYNQHSQDWGWFLFGSILCAGGIFQIVENADLKAEIEDDDEDDE